MKLKLALLAALGLAGVQAMACYTVTDANGRVVYNAQEAPVDMSQPLHLTVPRAFPGGHMSFDNSLDCPARAPQRVAQAGTRRAENAVASPLLTDTRTARALNLPYTQVAGGVAVVPARAAARVDLPTFTVVPPAVEMAGTPSDTRVMGAGRAPTQAMGASSGYGPLVSTDLHEPQILSYDRYANMK
jgi:hypothetical protein